MFAPAVPHVLEFPRVAAPLKPVYDWYISTCCRCWANGSRTTKAPAAMVESIRGAPDQESLKQMMEQAGFGKVEFHNLTAGIVAPY